MEVATGAVVPPGADAVVPYEACRRDGHNSGWVSGATAELLALV